MTSRVALGPIAAMGNKILDNESDYSNLTTKQF
jgi:hypothetical protein